MISFGLMGHLARMQTLPLFTSLLFSIQLWPELILVFFCSTIFFSIFHCRVLRIKQKVTSGYKFYLQARNTTGSSILFIMTISHLGRKFRKPENGTCSVKGKVMAKQLPDGEKLFLT